MAVIDVFNRGGERSLSRERAERVVTEVSEK